MIKYKHALALNPYFEDSTAAMGIFPPTGLEYIAASMKGLVGKGTHLDLRYEKAYQDPKALSKFIANEIDLLCISIRWPSQFEAKNRKRHNLHRVLRIPWMSFLAFGAY
jgi:hypothetical protein